MEINKYLFSHTEIKDAATIQAEEDNINVTAQLATNYNNFKETLDIFGTGKVVDISNSTSPVPLLTTLQYKHGYRNIDNVEITLENGNDDVVLQPGDFVYYVGGTTPRNYI